MRRQSRFASILAVAVLALPLAACQVTRTKAGELPKVEVQGGQLPEYEVKPAQVRVTSTPVEIEVPKVEVHAEKKTIEVPRVRLEMPGSSPTPTPHR